MSEQNTDFIEGIGNIRRLLSLPLPRVYKHKAKASRGVHHSELSKTTHLTPTQWFEAIFIANEKLPKSKKMTDLDILATWEREFPQKWPKEEGKRLHEFRKQRLTKLRDYRKRFNRGELYREQTVRHISWRYDRKGTKVDFSNGETAMTPDVEKRWMDTFKKQAGSRWAI